MAAAHLAARVSATHAKKSVAQLNACPLARRKRVVIVGAADDGDRIVHRLMQFPHRYNVLGIFDDRVRECAETTHDVPFLGSLDDLLLFCRKNLPDLIIISIFSLSRERFLGIFQKVRVIPADIYVALMERPEIGRKDKPTKGENFSTILVERQPLSGWPAVEKFLEDRLLALFLLIVLSPLFVSIAILIKCSSRGPVFFRQTRYGFNSNPIGVLKFRTMYEDLGDPSGVNRTVRDDPRVTWIGRYLRRYSLDELPQLLNVLKGEMSIVAPRAHVAAMRVGEEIYEDAVKDYLGRHRIKPGITGLAQVRGCRGEVKTNRDAKNRLCYDLFYINHWSLFFDIKIIFMTIYIVLFKNKNVY